MPTKQQCVCRHHPISHRASEGGRCHFCPCTSFQLNVPTRTLSQRYKKRCRGCGELFAKPHEATAGRLSRRQFCSRACYRSSPGQQRSSRTREVERLWQEGVLHQFEIAERVGLCSTRVSVILRRFRAEAERNNQPFRPREY